MRQVATHAGVSQKTVSRVFNDDPQVRSDTRERVQRAMQELGYVANPIAGVFRSGKVPAIGIAVPDIVDPFFASIVRAIDDVAHEADMSTLVTSLGDDPTREAEVVRTLLRRAPSGMIIAPIAPEQSYLKFAATGVPVVFVDREPVNFVSDTIRHDDVAGARLAVEYLVERGHRTIAFTGDSLQLPTTLQRLHGYRQVLDEAGLSAHPGLERVGVVDDSTAHHAVETLLELPEPPTAVFSANARGTMFLVPALQPTGLALISFGDFPMASSLTPPVSVVDQDPSAMGTLAAQRILDRSGDTAGGTKPKTTVLPVRLIDRSSCEHTD